MKSVKFFSLVTLFVTLFCSSPSFSANPIRESALQCLMIPPIVQVYFAHHFHYRKPDDELEKHVIDQFINRLDPSKAYLFKSDVEEIHAKLKGVLKKVGRDCSTLVEVQSVVEKRLFESLDFVKATLGKDFQIAETTEMVIDPKTRGWPAGEKEAREQLKKFIQFQMSNYVASELKMEEAKKQLIHRYELNLKRQREMKEDEIYALFLDAFANSLDAHSSFLSQEALEDFEISMKLSLEGIGAALMWEDGYTTVDALIPGGSAEKSGEIQPKDKIISVAQGNGNFETVIDMPLRDVVKLIRGKKGSTVRLTVLRQGPKETSRHVVALIRDKIALQDEAARLLYTEKKVGDQKMKLAVIELPSFYGDLNKNDRSCYEDVKKLVVKATKEKADGIVFDLSRNGGGLLSEAVRIAGLFIKEGAVVATQDSKQKMDILSDSETAVPWKGPMVVLTSRLSASASEIVSGALQDYKRAVIVGADHTFGKGTVQAMINLPGNLGATKVTTGMFFVPAGQSTQQRGVPADVVLPSVFSTKDLGEASLDYSLPPKSVAAFLSAEANATEAATRWTPIEGSIVQKLKELSTIRVDKDPEFKKIKDELAESEKNKGIINLGKSLKKQKEEKAKEKEKKVSNRSKRRQSDKDYLDQPQLKEAISVLGDLIRISNSSPHAMR